MDKIQPLQPLYKDEHGVIRFQSNKICEYLIEHGNIDLNKLAMLDFPQEDREQFAQLIGYSLSGFGDLSYVSNETYEAADYLYSGMVGSEEGGRVLALRMQLKAIKEGLKIAAAAAFEMCPEDFED